MRLEQNTPEWEQLRKTKIGASDAPAIMQVSPYRTPFQLWQEKLSLTDGVPKNWAMQIGQKLEPKARSMAEQILDMPLIPSVKLHSQRSWMMASLDAMSMDERTIAEIKCPGEHDHALAASGQIPEKYFPQLQHQMEVCEVDVSYYFSYYEEVLVMVKVFRDDAYIKRMISEEEKFLECMQNFEAPPLTDRDYREETSLEWLSLTIRYKQLLQYEEEKEEVRQKLLELCNGQNTAGYGVKVSKYPKKGAVDYKKVPELLGLDLEPYRKKTSECWRITCAN